MADKASTVAAIQAAIAGVQAIGTPPPPPPPPPPGPVPAGALSIKLDFGGGVVALFPQAGAVDQGDFIGEFVKQKCFLATNAAFPFWRVVFRPDTNGTREEVVVEYGNAFGAAAPDILTPFTATIMRGAVVVYTVVVPCQFRYSRWRWFSSQRPVVRTQAMLKARNWLPNFGTAGLFGAKPLSYSVAWKGPMSAPAGMSPGMGAAGDNPQIGYLTNAAAEYVLFDTPQSLVTLSTEGEWSANWCIHIRDPNGAPIDVRNQKLRTKDNGGTVNMLPTYPSNALPVGFVAHDSSHRYACANLPWLLTDDPYLLEELQFGCNDHLLLAQFHRTANNLQGMVYPGTPRAFAWGLRDVFLAALTTPATVPSWLLPQSYWQACVDDNHTYSMKFVNSTARAHALFKTWTRGDADPAWMASWLNAVVGMAIGMGFTKWLPIFQWGIDKHIQQTNGTSGWNRQWPVPYYSHPDTAAPTGSTLLSPSFDATTRLTWLDYWNDFKAGSPNAGVFRTPLVNDAGWDGHTLMQTNSTPSYYLHLRSALAVAVTRGIPGAQACYDYLHTELATEAMARFGKVGQPQFSIDPS